MQTESIENPLDIFKNIAEKYTVANDSVNTGIFDDFVSEHEEYLGEFDLKNIKQNDEEEPYLLLAGDLSGIQDTVYTISSKGALKSLRARSFMLELLCEHCCYELLTGLTGSSGYKELRKYVVFSGGGRFCLLLPNIDYKNKVELFKRKLNEWALREFSGRLYIAFACLEVTSQQLDVPAQFSDIWTKLGDELDADKNRKFSWKLDSVFKESELKEPTLKTNEQECQICHRDDLELESISPPTLREPLRVLTNEEELIKGLPPSKSFISNPNLTIAHELCFQLFHLGDRLTKKDLMSIEVVRMRAHPNPDNKNGRNGFLTFPDFRGDAVFYCINAGKTQKVEYMWRINAPPEACPEENCSIFLYADYARKVSDLPEAAIGFEKKLYFEAYRKKMNAPEKVSASFAGLAASACGADLIGCLRMDIDNLGSIFSLQGWKIPDDFTLNHLGQLSRLLNLFFKVFLSQICAGRIDKPTDLTGKDYAASPETDEVDKKEILSKRRGEPGRNVSIIYSGGDDLFIIGAWDEIAELSFDIQRCFAQYSGLGISGGVTLHKPKFPLYQMARLSGEAESFAKNDKSHNKGQLKNRIALFYDLNKKVRKETISKNLFPLANKADAKDRYRLAVTWSEFEKFVIPFTRQMQNFGDIKDGKWHLQKLPAATIEKLFSVAEEWQSKGQIYLPTMARIIEQTKNNLSREEFNKFLDHVYSFDTNNIKKIHIPLTWISYLRR